MPTVSIVIPCWNAGQYLSELFESLDAQTFSDFETILVDDGSTDPATLDALKTLPSAVTLIRQENRGLPGARNTGFRAATGEFFLPLDCDDRIAPSFLSKGIDRLRADPSVDFAFSHMQLVGARQGLLERGFNRFDQLFLNQLPYSLLMRRTAWERVGGYDEKMRQGYEDWDLNLRLIMTGSAGGLLPEPLFIYRVAEGGMLLSKSARQHGELWARIRSKHQAAYRRRNLMALCRSEGRGKLTLPTAFALLTAATLLPAPLFGAFYQRALASRTSGKGRATSTR